MKVIKDKFYFMIDPKTKLDLIDKIHAHLKENYSSEGEHEGEYFAYFENDRIALILSHVDIHVKGYFDYKIEILIRADGYKITKLAEYLFGNKNEGMRQFFHDKYATEILKEKEQYDNLNLYLEECFQCINSKNLIAASMLLRCCVEVFLTIQGATEYNLGAKITSFIKQIDQKQDFELFAKNQKKAELEDFIKTIKGLGDDVVHLNGKNLKDLIEKYDLMQMFKLFCILIENSILKCDIRQKNEDDIAKRVRSINFTVKEKDLDDNDDDPIPF